MDQWSIAMPVSRRRVLALGAAAGLGIVIPQNSATLAIPFTYWNRRIPDEAHTMMIEVGSRIITTFAFTPTGGWVVVTRDGGIFSRGIPRECDQKLREWLKSGYRIHCVAFPPVGGNSWVIAADRDVYARNIPEECWQRMLSFRNAGQQVTHVAFPPKGGNSWAVLASTDFDARNCSDDCYQQIRKNYQVGRTVKQVAFPGTGGWVVSAEDGFTASGIDPECHEKMLTLTKDGWQLNNIAFSSLNNGWSLYSHAKRTTSSAPTPTRDSGRDTNRPTTPAAPSSSTSANVPSGARPNEGSWIRWVESHMEGIGSILAGIAGVFTAIATFLGVVYTRAMAKKKRQEPQATAEVRDPHSTAR